MQRLTLPLIPIISDAMLPNSLQKLGLSKDQSKKAYEYAYKNKADICFVAQRQAENEIILDKTQLHYAGVVGRIIDKIQGTDELTLRLDIYKTVFVEKIVQTDPFIIAEVRYAEYTEISEQEQNKYKDAIKQYFLQLPQSQLRITGLGMLSSEKDFNSIINSISFLIDIENKQEFIEIEDTIQRVEILLINMQRDKQKREVLREIEMKVEKKVMKSQKEYILREQLKVISEELGEDDKEYKKLKQQIEELAADDEVKEKLMYELERLNRMSVMSPEFSMLRNYLDCALSLPWGVYTQDNYDLDNVKKTLDDDHYGLEHVKQRVVEYMAVKKITVGKNKAPILCFVGPPGVGKTSIAQSIARAIGKEYLHLSLGGIRDEAEIRGHRKTYIGSMPGRIMSSMAKAKTNNPLFLLDEIDKLTSDMRGDPSSALLEVLDPNQNFSFRDNYLEIPYDLSQVMFIMTANTLNSIQKPLLDRMEVIELSGYTLEEKTEIALRYLVPKQKTQNGLDKCDVEIDKSAIVKIIDSYTKEAGVRELERQVGNVCRKLATKIVGGENFSYEITEKNVEEFLGVKKYIVGEDVVNNVVGAVNGLAWTSVGGVLMPIEVKLLPNGKGDMILTGSLGDVMKESARIALSLVKSMSDKYNIPKETWTDYDIHINVPEGATPKDGPSAGISMTTALLSTLTNKAVRDDLAMTGEITLRGKVLAIGGLKEKTLAGLRNGIKTIIIPKQNQKDIADLPENVVKKIDLILADNISDVFTTAFS